MNVKKDHPLVVIAFTVGILFVSCQRHNSHTTKRVEFQKECDRLEMAGDYYGRGRIGCLESAYFINEEGRPNYLKY